MIHSPSFPSFLRETSSTRFKQALLQEHREAAAAVKQNQAAWQELKQAMLDDALSELLRSLIKKRADLLHDGKSVPWKLALAAALKTRTVATNRWLAENLQMGNLHEVSRKVSAWQRNSERSLATKLQTTPNPMA